MHISPPTFSEQIMRNTGSLDPLVLTCHWPLLKLLRGNEMGSTRSPPAPLIASPAIWLTWSHNLLVLKFLIAEMGSLFSDLLGPWLKTQSKGTGEYWIPRFCVCVCVWLVGWLVGCSLSETWNSEHKRKSSGTLIWHSTWNFILPVSSHITQCLNLHTGTR